MPNLNDESNESYFFKGLLVGKNGSGKTLAATSFPKPIRYYDFDGRMEPVKRLLSLEQKNDISYETLGPRDITRFCKEFQDLQDYNPYKTIVIDSLTALSISVVNHYLVMKGSKGKNIGTTSVPGWDEINGETSLISSILDVAKILKCHVIMTAHPVTKTDLSKDGGGRKSSSIVAFGNKLPSIVPNYFNEIYQFFIESGYDASNNVTPKYIIYTRPNTEEDMMKTGLPIPRKIDITSERTARGEKGYDFSLWKLIEEAANA